jgi:hypothetical protein
MTQDEQRVYIAWVSIKTRCHCPTSRNYKDYGGRGIRLSDEFMQSFEVFFEHLGPPPSRAHSVDRIDNNKGYDRGNIRWETKWGQMRNRRCTLLAEWKGKTQCLADWSKETGINKITLWGRFKQGLRGDALFAKPTNRGRQAVFETINGETKSLTQWALYSGVKLSTLIARYRYGFRGIALLAKDRLPRRPKSP